MSLLTIHGNPGFPSSFDQLKAFLPGPCFDFDQRSYRDINRELIYSDLRRHVSSDANILAYSWGGYLACRLLESEGLTVNNLIVLNPTLWSQSTVSSLSYAVLNSPFLGSLVARTLCKKLAMKFYESTFSAHHQSCDLQRQFVDFFSNGPIWRQALQMKKLQSSDPIRGSAKIANHIFLVFGANDVAVPLESQKATIGNLEKNNKIYTIEVPDYGHSLPWADFKTHEFIFQQIERARDGQDPI